MDGGALGKKCHGPCHTSQVPGRPCPSATTLPSLWAAGYQDSIAFSDRRFARMVAYIKDNPRRLARKRANRDLFKVVQHLPFHGGFLSSVGNLFLLEALQFIQVQCSRSATDGEIETLKNRILELAAMNDKQESTNKHPRTVVVSPCISPGEKAIARAAFEARLPLIVLKNKGFSQFYKPSGEYFDACAEGRLLMLAPGGWPFTTQKKLLTRTEACVLNRITQLICGEDACEINYKGMLPQDLEQQVARALHIP